MFPEHSNTPIMQTVALSNAHITRLGVAAGLILLTFAVLWFGALGYRNLNDPDEGRYAEIPREMLVTGNWVTPHLNGLKYFEKPPLQYWATAVAYELFGQSNATARLWSALTGFLTILWVFFVGARLFDWRAGLYAAGMLVSGLLWVAMGHLNTLDMGVTAFLTFAIGALALAQSRRDHARSARNWMLFGWAMLAAAVLSKGLIGLVFPGAAVVLYSLWQRDWTMWRQLHIGKGILLFLALTVPWFVAVAWANPGFLWFFFIQQQFLRYLTPVAQRMQPWWFFLVLVWVGMLPWVGSGFHALLRPGFRWLRGDGAFDPGRLFWVYAVFVLVFFSFSHSKLIPYMLPVFPAFALLAGHRLAVRGPGRVDATAAALLGVLLLLAAFNLQRLASHDTPMSLLVTTRPWLLAAGCLLLAGAVAAYWLRQAQQRTVSLALAALLGFQLLNWGYQGLSPIHSTRAMAQAMAAYTTPDTPIYSVGLYEQSLPFYLGRTVRLVAYRGEFIFAWNHNPGAWVPDMSVFKRLWRQDDKALAVMEIKEYETLAKSGLPMHVIYRDPRRIVVARQ